MYVEHSSIHRHTHTRSRAYSARQNALEKGVCGMWLLSTTCILTVYLLFLAMQYAWAWVRILKKHAHTQKKKQWIDGTVWKTVCVFRFAVCRYRCRCVIFSSLLVPFKCHIQIITFKKLKRKKYIKNECDTYHIYSVVFLWARILPAIQSSRCRRFVVFYFFFTLLISILI